MRKWDKNSFWSWGVGNQYKTLGSPRKVTIIGEFDTKFGKPSFNVLNIIPEGEIVYE